MAILTKLASSLRGFDIAAQPFELNIGGTTRFTTLCGGLTGLAIYTLILIFSYQQTQGML